MASQSSNPKTSVFVMGLFTMFIIEETLIVSSFVVFQKGKAYMPARKWTHEKGVN